MSRKFFRRILPSHESIQQNRHIARLGPWLQHHNLWHLHRRSVAGGVAAGMFAGLIPGSNPVQFLAAALLGTGNSMLYPTLVALVVDRTPITERGLAIGTLSGAWDVGVFVGAPLIALLVEAYGFPTGFLASALTVAAGLAAFLFSERGRRSAPTRAGPWAG